MTHLEYEIIPNSEYHSVDRDIVNKIDNFMSVEDLFSYLCDHNINIFMPDKHFLKVFHLLLQQDRMPDFLKLADFIKTNKDTYKWDYDDLKSKFYMNISNGNHELGPDQAIHLYSDLNQVALGGFQFNENHDQDIIKAIDFVSQELKAMSTDIFEQYF